jgi:hypothetical protein
MVKPGVAASSSAVNVFCQLGLRLQLGEYSFTYKDALVIPNSIAYAKSLSRGRTAVGGFGFDYAAILYLIARCNMHTPSMILTYIKMSAISESMRLAGRPFIKNQLS